MEKFNICIVRPPAYRWSSVFFELAELIAFSLQDNGYLTQVTENHLAPTGMNLIIGCHLMDVSVTPQIPSDTIILNTEQLGVGLDIWNQRILHFVQRFASWDYSADNIVKFKKLGIAEPKWLKFGYHPKLNRITSTTDKDIDVLFYGNLNEPRLQILNEIERRGARVAKLFGVFGTERDAYIARSKLVLNLHQHQTKVFEIVRVHYLMNNSKAIVSQCDADTKIDPNYMDGLLLADYDSLVDKCLAAIESAPLLQACEQRSLATLKQFDAVSIIGEMVAA